MQPWLVASVLLRHLPAHEPVVHPFIHPSIVRAIAYLQLVSTAKHFSAYDLEDSDMVNRHNFTAVVTQQDLSQFYWPPFLAATQRGKVNSIMCSYNAVQIGNASNGQGNDSTGYPSCAWSWANNDVLRDSWGWPGFIVSDCGAIQDIYQNHKFTPDAPTAAAAGILGGTDVNCGSIYGSSIPDAVNAGLLTLADLQVAGTRLLTVAFETGLFEVPGTVVYDSYGPDK